MLALDEKVTLWDVSQLFVKVGLEHGPCMMRHLKQQGSATPHDSLSDLLPGIRRSMLQWESDKKDALAFLNEGDPLTDHRLLPRYVPAIHFPSLTLFSHVVAPSGHSPLNSPQLAPHIHSFTRACIHSQRDQSNAARSGKTLHPCH